jgi:hypothetical protein
MFRPVGRIEMTILRFCLGWNFFSILYESPLSQVIPDFMLSRDILQIKIAIAFF